MLLFIFSFVLFSYVRSLSYVWLMHWIGRCPRMDRLCLFAFLPFIGRIWFFWSWWFDEIHAILRIWLLYTLDSIYEYPFVHDYCENTPFYLFTFSSIIPNPIVVTHGTSMFIVSPMEYQIINYQPWLTWERVNLPRGEPWFWDLRLIPNFFVWEISASHTWS